MLSMARKDLSALENMTNRDTFADEIFGFHSQQAVEKALKAWLSALGVVYPKIHDLEELLATLSDHGQDTTPYEQLVDLNDFAVQYRYDAFTDLGDELDRTKLVRDITELIANVEKAVSDE
jgi:HEPN domain-containing protein